jgi:hypothetical protein
MDEPAIVSACCWHARPDLAALCFVVREALHGEAALTYFAEHSCGPTGSLEERARKPC